MSDDHLTPAEPRTLPQIIEQAAQLHKQVKALSDMHKPYYHAAECFYALAQDPPEKPTGDLSLFSAYLQDCMFAVMEKAEYLMKDLADLQV